MHTVTLQPHSKRHVLPHSTSTLNFSEPVARKFSLEQLREKAGLYMSGLLSGEPVWYEVSRVVQTKGEKHLGITTTADFSLHSCFAAVMNYFQATVIHHKADNESTLTALFELVYCMPLYCRQELLHSLWKLTASLQIAFKLQTSILRRIIWNLWLRVKVNSTLPCVC